MASGTSADLMGGIPDSARRNMAFDSAFAVGDTKQASLDSGWISSAVPPTSDARNGTPIVRHSPTTQGLFSTRDGITHREFVDLRIKFKACTWLALFTKSILPA